MIVRLPKWAKLLDLPTAPDERPVRHRVFHGGRGGGKSWTIATKLIERAIRRRTRVLCLREFQNSLRDSSKLLIEDLIERMGLGTIGSGFFRSKGDEIVGRNGSVFRFVGLNGREASIKSLEAFDLAWVEEAATISQAAIDALLPTIRGRGSEIWWTYNPRYETDPVDRMFRSDDGPPPGTIIRQVTFRDNPWFPDVLAVERDYDRRRDPDKYQHVWEGGYVLHSDATVFSNWRVLPFELPADATLLFGADWGFAVDPTVLVRCAVGRWLGAPGESEIVADAAGDCLFVDWEAYKVRCELDDTPALFAGSDKRNPPRWTNRWALPGIPGAARNLIWADSARPETISHLVKRGFTVAAAKKGPGSVEDGIALLKNLDLWVHPRCENAIRELRLYRWKVDRHTGAILPMPADTHNHVIDALRYAMDGVRRGAQRDHRFASAGPRVITSKNPGHELADAASLRRWHQQANGGVEFNQRGGLPY